MHSRGATNLKPMDLWRATTHEQYGIFWQTPICLQHLTLKHGTTGNHHASHHHLKQKPRHCFPALLEVKACKPFWRRFHNTRLRLLTTRCLFTRRQTCPITCVSTQSAEIGQVPHESVQCLILQVVSVTSILHLCSCSLKKPPREHRERRCERACCTC